MHADREQGYELLATRAVDLILTGHNHDLFIKYDGRNAMVEFELRRALRHRDRRHHRGEASRTARRATTWWPQFRVIDTATVTPDPEVAAVVAKFEAELTQRDGRAARHHRGRARQPQRHRAHARGRDRQPDRRRHARASPAPTSR